MTDWIIAIGIIVLIFFITFKSKCQSEKSIKNKVAFDKKNIASDCVLVLLVFFLNRDYFYQLDFQKIGKGFLIDQDILTVITTIFIVPFFLTFFLKNYLYPKDISSAKEIFGYPTNYLPNTHKEYFWFSLSVITGVIFEELICRQFLFLSFYNAFHLKGDTLLIVSSFLFAIGHIYQGWKGVVPSFFMGLALGKIFQMQENIWYPIVLHLFFNCTMLVLAFRRMKDLKKLQKYPKLET